jgi:PKD repeat protein
MRYVRVGAALLGAVVILGMVAGGAMAADDWPDDEYQAVSFGEYTGDIDSSDDTDLLKIAVETGDVVNLSLSSDTPSEVIADISYPDGEGAFLDGENPSQRITIEDEGYIYVDIEGYSSDFAEFPYSWTFSADKESNSDEWTDDEYAAVGFGEYSGEINTEDDSDELKFQVEAGDVVNLSLSSDTPSEVVADIGYPNAEGAFLDGENPSERITIEDDGYIYVDIEGYSSDFAEFPYSWTFSANKTTGADEWIDDEHRSVEFGTYSGDINTEDDSDELRFQVQAGDVVNLSLSSDTPSEVTAEIGYPNAEGAFLDGENPSERITIEDDGYIYVDIEGYTADFAEFPYSWTLSANRTTGADEWIDDEHRPVEFGEHSGEINTEDDSDELKLQVQAGDVVDLSLSSDTPSEVTAEIGYPNAEGAFLDGENPSERITIEDDGYIYVDIEGYSSDFAEFPYSWTFNADRSPEEDRWIDGEYRPVDLGEYDGKIDSEDDSDRLKFQVEGGEVINLSLGSNTLSEVTADIDYPGLGSAFLDADNPHEQITVEERGYIYVNIEGASSDFAEFPYSWSLFVGPPDMEASSPTANLSISSTTVTAGEQVSFDATGSTAPDGRSITSYEWDFTGDGSTDATGATVTHTYETAGTYEVSVTVTDSAGTTDTATASVTVEESANDGATVHLAPDTVSLQSTSTSTVNIVIRNTSDIGVYDFDLSLTDSAPVQITDISLKGNPGVTNVTIGSSGQSASVEAAAADIGATGQATIASIEITGSEAGETTLEAQVNNLGDLEGNGYDIAEATATTAVTVQDGPGDVTGNGKSATDPDNDGVYEDINGDGSADVLDVQSLFGNLDSEAVTQNPAFDMNGDGSVDILDVQALFSQI